MRREFISRLAASSRVNEPAIRAIAGHVDRQMLERYSPVRSRAMEAAIQVPEQPSIELVLWGEIA